MSTSEYLRCAPKYTISRLNNHKFSGASPPLGASGTSILAPSALATRCLWRLNCGGALSPKYFSLELHLLSVMNCSIYNMYRVYNCFVARMDVTKQEDMSAFYRNLLDQTTDCVIKTEPSQSEDNAERYEWHMYFTHATTCHH